MDIGDIGDNFHDLLIKYLKFEGLSDDEALWISHGAIAAAVAGFEALSATLDPMFGGLERAGRVRAHCEVLAACLIATRVASADLASGFPAEQRLCELER